MGEYHAHTHVHLCLQFCDTLLLKDIQPTAHFLNEESLQWISYQHWIIFIYSKSNENQQRLKDKNMIIENSVMKTGKMVWALFSCFFIELETYFSPTFWYQSGCSHHDGLSFCSLNFDNFHDHFMYILYWKY